MQLLARRKSRWTGRIFLLIGFLPLLLFSSRSSCQPGAMGLPAEEPIAPEQRLPRLKPRPSEAVRVVLFMMEGLVGEDLRDGLTVYGPVALWLETRSAAGLLATMGFGGSDRYRALATLSGGMKSFGDETVALTLEAEEQWEGGRAWDAYKRAVGMPPFLAPEPFQTLLNPYLLSLSRKNQLLQFKSVPFGVLADSLRARGLQVFSVGCSDRMDPQTGRLIIDRAPLLPGLTGTGVGAGRSGTVLLKKDPFFPFGIATDENVWFQTVKSAWRYADLLVLATGDDARACVYGSERLFPIALAHSFRLLGRVRRLLRPDRDLLIVLSYGPRAGFEASLPPIWIVGKGFGEGGLLSSSSTYRKGIVTLADVGATILSFFSAEPIARIQGTPIFALPFQGDLVAKRRYLAGLSRAIRLQDQWIRPVALNAWCWVAAFLFFVLSFLLATGKQPSGTLRRLALFLGFYPTAVHLGSATFNSGLMTGVHPLLGVATAGSLVLWLASWSRRWTEGQIATVLLIASSLTWVSDSLLGGKLSADTVFGSSSFTAARFYGLGNAGAGLLVGALVSMPLVRSGVAITAITLLGAVFLCGAPLFGADIGGALMAAAGLVALISARKGLKWSLAAVLIPVAVLTVFAGIELSRPEPLTHWGRFLREVFGGDPHSVVAMVHRKITISLRVFRAAHWDAAFLSSLLLLMSLSHRLGGDWRTVTLFGLAVGALIFNDTGPQTPFAVLFYPLIVMAVLYSEKGTAVEGLRHPALSAGS